MKKLIAGLSLSVLCASNAFADCAKDLKTFEEGKAFVVDNAKRVAELAEALNVAATKEITIDNDRLFDGTVRELDALSVQIKANRNKFNHARENYQKAGCGKTAAPASAPATPEASAAPATPAETVPAAPAAE